MERRLTHGYAKLTYNNAAVTAVVGCCSDKNKNACSYS
jgi:hypothetical protein